MSEKRKELIEDIVRENMRSLSEIRDEELKLRCAKDRLADGITVFSGSMPFVWIHVVWFVIWIAINLGWTPIAKFDPFPFGLLTMIVSLEAIFLSTFVLISQNRASKQTEDRADLDLQINLLAERETTKILSIVDAIAKKVGATDGADAEATEMEQQITIKEMIDELHRTERSQTKVKT